MRFIAPRLGPARPVPGPPKRFAQAIGTAFSTAALVCWFGPGWHLAALVLVGLLGAAALLESAGGICLGCIGFAALMRAGLIPESVLRGVRAGVAAPPRARYLARTAKIKRRMLKGWARGSPRERGSAWRTARTRALLPPAGSAMSPCDSGETSSSVSALTLSDSGSGLGSSSLAR